MLHNQSSQLYLQYSTVPGNVRYAWLSMGVIAWSRSVTSVVVPPAPRVPELTAAQLKENKDREYQRKKGAHASRRSVQVATTAGGRPVEAHYCKWVRIADDD